MNVTTHSFNRYRTVALSLAVALTACADRDARYELSMRTLAPVAAGNALVYVQPALARATVVDLSQATPAVRQVAVGDDPVLVIGGSGGTRIVTSVEQAAWRAIVLRAPVGEAVAHPRIHQAAQPEELSAEAATAEGVVAELRARGHQTDSLRYGAIVQAIRIARGADGVSLEAASDPRKGGRPAGR